MAASSTDRLPPAGCTIAIVSTFFAPPPAYLSTPRILHLQGGVTLKTLPVLNYPVPRSLPPSFPLFLSPSVSLSLTFSTLSHSLYSSLTDYYSSLSVLSTELSTFPKSVQFVKFTQRQVGRPLEKSLSSPRG